MRNLICLSLSGFVVATACYVGAQPGKGESTEETKRPVSTRQVKKEPERSPLQSFMHQKLEASNQILEGLVIDKMQKVNAGADILLEMSDAEKWRASNDMLYLQHSRSFRDSVKELKKKAKKGSVDGAALAWMDVTLNCIQCHEWVRNVLIADSTSISQPPNSNEDTQ